ncbi:MAG: hypothetical protein M3R55_09885 [Acidobacteriota bacterium]|nr:hypothetical protein [Acidobacteriota bacterium]
MIILIAALAQVQTPPPATAPPARQAPANTDVFLVSFTDPSAWKPESVTNISASPGYDNQPSFMRDSRSVIFTSNRDGRQSDIYRYWVADKKLTQLTETAESEYSPTVTPRGDGFTVIQVEADQTQRLWQFDLAGRAPRVVLADVKPVGYHAWVDPSIVMLFVLGQPATLQRAQPGSPTAEIVASGIGRSLVAIPGTRAVSFTTRDEQGVWWIKRYDADTRAISTLVQAPEGAGEPHCAWTRDGRLITAFGSLVFSWKVGQAGWTVAGDLGASAVKNISRLAVSPDGRWLAFVAETGVQ